MSYRTCSHSSLLDRAPSRCIGIQNTQPVSPWSALPRTGKCSHRKGSVRWWLVALSRPSLPRDHKWWTSGCKRTEINMLIPINGSSLQVQIRMSRLRARLFLLLNIMLLILWCQDAYLNNNNVIIIIIIIIIIMLLCTGSYPCSARIVWLAILTWIWVCRVIWTFRECFCMTQKTISVCSIAPPQTIACYYIGAFFCWCGQSTDYNQ